MSGHPLHRAQLDLGDGICLDIEATRGQGAAWVEAPLPARVLRVEAETDGVELGSSALPAMCLRDSGALFEPFQLREETEYFVDITVPLAIESAITLAHSSSEWPFVGRFNRLFRRDPPRRWKASTDPRFPGVVISGRLSIGSYAGIIRFATALGGEFSAEVVCRKLTYFDEFQVLLDEVSARAVELLFKYDSPVSLEFDVTRTAATSDSALHFLMRYVMSPSHLPCAIADIVASPHTRLVSAPDMVTLEELSDVQADLLADLDAVSFVSGGPFARLFRGFSPAALPQDRIDETTDTPENRYCKAFLERCQAVAQALAGQMRARGAQGACREAQQWSNLAQELLQHSMWRTIGPYRTVPSNSRLLHDRRGYKDILRLDTALRMAIGLSWDGSEGLSDGLSGDVRPVSDIYEYWCYFVLREIIGSCCSETSSGSFLVRSSDGLRLSLRKGKRSVCRFRYDVGNGRLANVSLFYNRRFQRPSRPSGRWQGSYTAAFNPDFSILIESASTEGRPHWLHFDAKYRLERAQADYLFAGELEGGTDRSEASEYDAELSRIHRRDDLYKMHTYRDGILGTRGAYVLFPGDGLGGRAVSPAPNFFVRHPASIGGAGSRMIPSVGAFDLAPGGKQAQADAIRALLLSVLNLVVKGGDVSEERSIEIVDE